MGNLNIHWVRQEHTQDRWPVTHTTHSLTYWRQFRVSSQTIVHVFGPWEETGVNPHRQCPPGLQKTSRRPLPAAETAELARVSSELWKNSHSLMPFPNQHHQNGSTADAPPLRQPLLSGHSASERLHSTPQWPDKLCLCSSAPSLLWVVTTQPWWMHRSNNKRPWNCRCRIPLQRSRQYSGSFLGWNLCVPVWKSSNMNKSCSLD